MAQRDPFEDTLYTLPTWATLAMCMEAILFTWRAWPVWLMGALACLSIFVAADMPVFYALVGIGLVCWLWADISIKHSKSLAQNGQLVSFLSQCCNERGFARWLHQRYAKRIQE